MATAKRAAEPRAKAQKPQKDWVDLVTSEVSLAAQFSRIGGNLTPARVSVILQQADAGQPAALVDLFHELRQKSGHFQSIMQAREVCVASIPFDIAPRADEPKKIELKAARQCAQALKGCDSFQNAVAHWVGEGNAFGHATSELVWRVEERGELAGLMVPDRFVNISCRRFAFRSTDGALLFDPSGFPSGSNIDAVGVDLLELYGPGKYFQYRPRVNGDVLVREGLARVLIWGALFENFDIRDWLQLAEMAWKPKRTGKYKKEATKQDKQALTNILERLTTTGVAIYPDTVELMLHWPSNYMQGSPHRELAEFLGRQMSKAVLGTADAQEQQGPNGARAAVKERNELRGELKAWDAVGIAKLVTRNFVEPFYQLNYGEKREPGTYVPMLEDPTDVLAFGTGIMNLRKAGLKVSQAWVRKQIGAPEPKKGEELLSDGDPKPDSAAPDGTGKKPKPAEDEADDAA